MIRYALSCDAGHTFDAWFRSSDDYDRQADRGLLTCPRCNSAKISKGLMAPRVQTAEAAAAAAVPAPAAPASAPPAMQAMLASPEGREMVARLRELKTKMLENSENVGRGFAEEARKIHYGEAPARTVHGEATPDEARALVEEGVGILPLPVLPDEQN